MGLIRQIQELGSEFDLSIDEDEANSLLWNETCFPFLRAGDWVRPEECWLADLRKAFEGRSALPRGSGP